MLRTTNSCRTRTANYPNKFCSLAVCSLLQLLCRSKKFVTRRTDQNFTGFVTIVPFHDQKFELPFEIWMRRTYDVAIKRKSFKFNEICAAAATAKQHRRKKYTQEIVSLFSNKFSIEKFLFKPWRRTLPPRWKIIEISLLHTINFNWMRFDTWIDLVQ